MEHYIPEVDALCNGIIHCPGRDDEVITISSISHDQCISQLAPLHHLDIKLYHILLMGHLVRIFTDSHVWCPNLKELTPVV